MEIQEVEEQEQEQGQEQQYVVEKTEEGVRFEEQQLPIDINYSKFADWLVDRKKVPSDWRKRLAGIQTRINQLLPDLPRGSHTELLSLPTQSEGSSVGYLEAKNIRDTLAAANPQDRTLFGGYSGTTGKWDSVVRTYEKDLTFLGEASAILVQNTNYDIPFFRKQAAKTQQQIADLDRKESEYRKAAAASSQAFQASCKTLGIEGNDIRSELLALLHGLPNIFQDVVDTISSSSDIGTALDYYQQFMAHVHAQEGSAASLVPVLSALRTDPKSAECPESKEHHSLTSGTTTGAAQGEAAPSINWDLSEDRAAPISIDWGDASTADSAAAPVSIDWGEASSADTTAAPVSIDWGEASTSDTAAAPILIDWGEVPTGEEGASMGINWDISAAEVEGISGAETSADVSGPGETGQGMSAAPVIQWDIGTASEVTSANETREADGGSSSTIGVQPSSTLGIASSSTPEIVWDFAIEESGAEKDNIVMSSTGEGGITEELNGHSKESKGHSKESKGHVLGAASVSDAMRAVSRCRLCQPEYRNQLLDDLFELRAFLREREAEMRREEGSPLQTQLLAAAPHGPLQELSANGLSTLEAAVRDVVLSLTCRQTTDLLLMYSSTRYVDRMEATLRSKKGNEARLLGSIDELNRKRQDLRTSLSAMWLKQDEAIKRTRKVKEFVERSLTAQYAGRPVNIIGEINNQLGTTL